MDGIKNFFEKRQIREAKAETYLDTYSVVDSSSFLAQQVANRDSASWKKAQYIVLKDSENLNEVLNGWKQLTNRDPQFPSSQKLCVPVNDGFYDVYDASGEKKENTTLEAITPKKRRITKIESWFNDVILNLDCEKIIDSTGDRALLVGEFVISVCSENGCIKVFFSVLKENIKANEILINSLLNEQWFVCVANENFPKSNDKDQSLSLLKLAESDLCLYRMVENKDSAELILKNIIEFLKSNKKESNQTKPLSSSFTPAQTIYYGVPGCGKSNTIKEKLKNVPDFNKVCVVFHPDYTNSEFIGQIRPKIRNHSVTYEFVAGPFAKILRRAYLNPDQEFYLVIDEINRGKASAILGEVFQLCDRIKPNDEKDEFGYGPSWSVYGIDHEDLNDYIRDIRSFANESHDGCDTPVEFSEEDGRGEVFAYKSIDINWLGFGENGKLHFTENTAIRLPPNLSIFATMNTSDQNVFTLDNAFQRRFDMELVRNEFAKGEVDGFKTEAIRNQHNAKIAGTETTWGEFWEWANNKITQVLKGLSSTEDKRLGVWFICNVNGEIPEKIFAEKVLKYLWDDAFKFKRPQIFAEGCDTLETLISKFHELKFGVFKSFGA